MTLNVERLLEPSLFEQYQSQPALGIAGTRDTPWRFGRLGLSKYLRSTDRVLDIGCNEGAMSFEVSRHVHEVVALDVHQPFVDRARELSDRMGMQNCRFVHASFQDTHFEGVFDVILSLAVHYWMPDLPGYVRKLRALIKPGGILVIESHNLAEERHARDWLSLRSCLVDCQLIAGGNLDDEIVKSSDIKRYLRRFELWRVPIQGA